MYGQYRQRVNSVYVCCPLFATVCCSRDSLLSTSKVLQAANPGEGVFPGLSVTAVGRSHGTPLDGPVRLRSRLRGLWFR